MSAIKDLIDFFNGGDFNANILPIMCDEAETELASMRRVIDAAIKFSKWYKPITLPPHPIANLLHEVNEYEKGLRGE